MSHMKHATVSAWQRDHLGHYTTELNGYQLKVMFSPAHGDEPRGFRWEAVSPGGTRIAPRETHEEMEIAMAEAEAAALSEGEGEGGDVSDAA